MKNELAREVARQDAIHPDGYPATRDGLRLGIAALEDELDEVYLAWRSAYRAARRVNGDPDWLHLRAELVQVAGVCVRMIRSLDGD